MRPLCRSSAFLAEWWRMFGRRYIVLSLSDELNPATEHVVGELCKDAGGNA
jgi:hypothetical protein